MESSQTMTDCRTTEVPPLWPYLVICAAAGLMVSLGSFHWWHNSDSLIPMLVSLQKWTPFFWEQDRIGMLVPLLTLPLREPLWNLIAQEAIYVSTTLAAMFLLPRYVLRDGNYVLAGVLSVISCLVLAPGWLFCFSAFTFYGVWLALGLGGLIVIEAEPSSSTSWRRWLMAIVLMVLAHWVYSATALLLGPLVVARYLIRGRRAGESTLEGTRNSSSSWTSLAGSRIRRILKTKLVGELILLGVGFLFGFIFFRLAREFTPYHASTHASPVRQWPHSWGQLWINGWTMFTPYYWPYFLLGVAFVGLMELGALEKRRQALAAGRAALVVMIAAAVYFLFMGTRQWMALNSYSGRYALPSLFFGQGAVAIFTAGSLSRSFWNGLGWRTHVLSALGILLAAWIGFKSPSISTVHKDLERRVGIRTNDIVAAHCTHVAGDYWNVWTSVFHANMLLREQGDKRTVWGITVRAGPTRSQWQHLPLEKLRVAVPLDDMEAAQNWFQAFQMPPMTVVEKRPTIYVLRPLAVVQQEAVVQHEHEDLSNAKERHYSMDGKITN